MSPSSSCLSLCLVVFFVLISCVSALVPFPYTFCSSPGPHVKILTIEGNVWPPVSGQTLSVEMTGILNKNISSGDYSVDVSLDGIHVTTLTGDINEFKPLPWIQGNMTMNFNQDIPGGILPGTTCSLRVSAVDQDNTQLFCITLSFTFKAADISQGIKQVGRALPLPRSRHPSPTNRHA